MDEFDIVVLGGGTGNLVADAASSAGLTVALVERGRLGGTCLNRGCNPSKKLIQHANVVETVRNAGAFGVDATLNDVDYAGIVDEVISGVEATAEAKAERAREDENITFYRAEGRFVDERTVEVDVDGGTWIRGDRVVLAGGSRPTVPDSIDGTDEAEFLTSDEALRLRERPDRLAIVGGGYIAVEMGYFFRQMGSEVVVVGHGDVLAGREDREVAERLTAAYDRTCDLRLGYEATSLAADGDGTVVAAEDGDGGEIEVRSDEVLLATGRRPNSDSWNVEAAGIETDGKGFVETNEYLETSADGVWAIGDIAKPRLASSRTPSGEIAGNYMFKHSGDQEAEYAVENAVRGNRRAVEYPGMAHAIFGSPQVAALGRTEAEVDDDTDYEVGTCEYEDTVLGSALKAEDGFAKVIVGSEGEILGFHVLGPHASILVHEVGTAVAAGADARRVAETIRVHPALSEVVQGAFRDVYDLAPSGI